MWFVNFTAHKVSDEQAEQADFVELHEVHAAEILHILDFKDLPTPAELVARAERLAAIACAYDASAAMIGGAPFFMAPLEKALRQHGIKPCYAFSIRNSVEFLNEEGFLVKKSGFKHLDFYFS